MHHVMFCHSIRSDWNHGNAHFLRGLASAIQRQGDTIDIHEPVDGWSAKSLEAERGAAALDGYRKAYPDLRPSLYGPKGPDLDTALQDADVVLVHEWTDPDLVRRLSEHHRRTNNYSLYFHDTHHRAITQPDTMAGLPFDGFTGVLAFGDALRDAYLERGWSDHVWTWHEAADPHVFAPPGAPVEAAKDIVWIGNWGDEERTAELEEFLMAPAEALGLSGTVHGVRYPQRAMDRIRQAGLEYGAWIPNIQVAQEFARHRLTVHVPRRPYLEALPGIPTIRMFEAFSAGIPLVVARWRDTERLFVPDAYLRVEDQQEMQQAMRALLQDPASARRMAERARQGILDRHTCAHRLQELERIDRRMSAVHGNARPSIAFFGSSLLSSHWNGAATYYRGLLGALARLGHRISFYEPDAFGRQEHRDMDPPSWASVRVYDAAGEADVRACLDEAAQHDVVVKASGVGVHDALLEREVAQLGQEGPRVLYWDVDAPATLGRMHADADDPLRKLVPLFDGVFTYGGGPRVVQEYLGLGAARCVPVYNAADPRAHHPVDPDPSWSCDLAFLGNRLPDREARVQEFFLKPARALPDARFVLGGAGWEPGQLPANVRHVGHVGSRQHNVMNCSARMVLNINRDSMAAYGHSPATRVFEAAAAGACIVSDAWPGIEDFLTPDKEILLAENGDDVVRILQETSPEEARRIGQAARRRVLAQHTYGHRAMQVTTELGRMPERKVLA